MYVTCSGSTLSLNEVNPLTSVNKNVAYLFSPPSLIVQGFSVTVLPDEGLSNVQTVS